MNVENIPLTKIQPSKTNPRKHFDETYIAGLSDSIRKKGIIQPLTLRPDWCIGKTDEEIGQVNGNAPPPEFFEIVAGECRYRGARGAELMEVPSIVRHYSDAEAFEIQLVENLQRSDLTALEEAEGYRHLIDTYGYTVEMIHQKTGKDRKTIYNKLTMLKAPAVLLDAMVKEIVGEKVCELVARIPSPEMRERAAEEILNPRFLQEAKNGGLTVATDQPMSYRVAQAHVRDNFMRSLALAPFNQGDETLLEPEHDEFGARIAGGACTDCPRRSGNMPELLGDLKRPDICTNPGCYRRKNDVFYDRLRKVAAKEGKRILTDDEASAIFEDGDRLWFDSPWEKLSDKPDAHEVRDGVKVPTWRKLLEACESKPEIVLAPDDKGRLIELVDRKLAIEAVNLAAKQKGEKSIFDRSTSRPTSTGTASTAANGTSGDAGSGGAAATAQEEGEEPEWKKQDRKNKEVARFRFAVTLAAMTDLVEKIAVAGVDHAFWDALIFISLKHAGHEGQWLIVKRLQMEKSEDTTNQLLEYGRKLGSDAAKAAFVVELLLSQEVKIYNSGSMGGIRFVDRFKTFAKLYDVDIGETEKRVKGADKEKKAAKHRAKPDGQIHWQRRPEPPYKFNSNGVCEAPAVLVLPFSKSTKTTARIFASLHNKKWATGCDVSYGTHNGHGPGGFSGLPNCSGRRFEHLRDALVAEAQSIHKQLQSCVPSPVLKLVEMHIGTIKKMDLPWPVKSAAPVGTAEHDWEKIVNNKYRCRGCGAAAVKQGKKLIVEKAARGKSCPQTEAKAAPAKPNKSTKPSRKAVKK